MEESTTDILLYKLIRQNDEKALTHLFNKYFVHLCRYINLFITNQTDSEDLALEIFVHLWENRHKLDIVDSVKSYLFRTARNRSLNYLRDKKETISIHTLSLDPIYLQDDSLELEELDHLLCEAIESLPEKCKKVFIKSRDENLSNKKIAEELQISIKTVEAQITKALKHIQKYIDRGK
ncbi:RNA polymerase sigma-70 factor [Bacteroides sp. 519]|nr:RNA polymerase sigma-70 factor [Bacteroides sp. 519]